MTGDMPAPPHGAPGEKSPRAYHVQCDRGEVGGYVLLPGDPARVAAIAARLDGAQPVAANREFTTWTGSLAGVPVSVVSTGIGGPSAAIAVEELCDLGAHTFVRVGTCGSMQPGLVRGDAVIAQAAVRDEGTSHQYIPGAWPAVADLDVIDALRDAARAAAAATGLRWRSGVVQSKDSFYGEMDPGRMPVAAELQARWEAWTRAGVLASEMECAGIFTVAAVRRARGGAVLGIVNSASKHMLPDADELPITPLLELAVEAVRRLIVADVAAGRDPGLRREGG